MGERVIQHPPSNMEPDKFMRWVMMHRYEAERWASSWNEKRRRYDYEYENVGDEKEKKVDDPSVAVVDNWMRLATSVLYSAVEDCENGDVEACEWLTEFGGLYTIAIDFDVDVEDWAETQVQEIMDAREQRKAQLKERRIAELEAKGIKVATLD